MKHDTIMNMIRPAAVFALCVSFLLAAGAPDAAAQSKKADKSTHITVTVVDENGEGIPNAEISAGEGASKSVTDAYGQVSFTADIRDLVTVRKDGYTTVTALVEALGESSTVTLQKDLFLAGASDLMPLPYTEMLKRYSVGTTIVIKGEELEHYSSTDLRNALTAIAPGVEVTENFGDPGVNTLENANRYGAAWAVTPTARGRRMIYMVDNVPVHLAETPLDPQQIESITIVRDVMEKTLYGPSGAEGIVYIKTKQGKFNDRYLNVFYEGGVNMVDRMPEYVDGSTYARLNNVARNNSGLTPLYTEEDVNAYKAADPYSLTHPNVNFREMMLRKVAPYHKAGVQSGGGNDVVRYFTYLGYAGEGDLYKIGPVSDYNRVNVNANLDVKLNRFITARFGLVSTMGIRRSNNYGYSANYSSESEDENTTLGVTEFPEILGDINGIPAISFPIYANNDPELESPWYAVSSLYTQNPVANILNNGFYTETIRKGLMNLGLDIDLGFITPGLKSWSYGSFDATNLVRLGTAEDYAAYLLSPTVVDGETVMTPVQSSSHSVKTMSNKTKLLDYFSNRLYFVQKFNYDRTFGKHKVTAGADYMITKRSQKFITEHRREMNFGTNFGYVYDDRFIAQAALNVHGTYSLLSCWAFSPSFGLGWIISSEDWMKGATNIDFLKLRAEAGLLHYDSATSAHRDVDNYTWNNGGAKFGPYKNNQWFGNTTSENINRTYVSMLGNPNLRMERRHEFSAGLDMVAFNKRFNLSATAYGIFSDGPITQLANVLPLVAGISSGALWMNYNETLNTGAELTLGWKDKVGDFSYAINGWGTTSFSKVLRVDELNYSVPYRSQVGYPSTAIWGLRCLGTFATDEETTVIPQLYDETLHASDLKYQDMNGDGFIDDNDICMIGDRAPKLIYGLTLNLKYKDVDLFVAGTGRAFNDVTLTNSYFWNGWGDGNYSKYTLDNLGKSGAPKLCYNKVSNNYLTSTYWVEKGGFFKLQTVELGYELPCAKLNIARSVRGLRLYVRGNNLLTVSKIKDVDPESMSSGLTNYPLMKTFVGGIKVTF